MVVCITEIASPHTVGNGLRGRGCKGGYIISERLNGYCHESPTKPVSHSLVWSVDIQQEPVQATVRLGSREMNCQRCLSGEGAYRVHTDAIDMKVCAACAAEARRLGIAVEVLVGGEGS